MTIDDEVKDLRKKVDYLLGVTAAFGDALKSAIHIDESNRIRVDITKRLEVLREHPAINDPARSEFHSGYITTVSNLLVPPEDVP